MHRQAPGSLPKEVITPISAKTLASILGSTWVLVFAICIAMNSYLASYPERRPLWSNRGKWQVLDNLKAPVDWLVLGDSSGAFSIDRQTFEDGIGGTSVNLATTANHLPITDAWMLQEYMKRFGPPKGILLVRGIWSWTKRDMGSHSRRALADVPRGWGYWSKLYPRLNFGFWDKLYYLQQRFLPILTDPLGARALFHPELETNPETGILYGDGYLALSTPNPEKVLERSRRALKRFNLHGHNIPVSNLYVLDTFGRLSLRDGFEVYMIDGPIYRELFHAPNFQKHYWPISKRLSRLMRGHPHIARLLERPMLFEADEMENPDHIVHPATVGFTQRIVSLIKVVRSARKIK
jgi:hypothetical protein